MSKIMIVDDEPDVAYILKTVLVKEGYKVIEASNGKECLEKVKEEKPKLILLDIMMPDINGWEVCKEIKENPSTSYIPVSMLSIKGDDEDKKKSFEYAHADEHLTKPINFEEVISTVETLLNKAHSKALLEKAHR
jgi:CheY-like chemotaxis protein